MSQTNLVHGAAPAEAKGPDLEPVERKRILVVEGDGFTRLVLLLRLRLAGFGVDFTSNGILGLGKLRTCHPDILLVELKLCGLSGLELIKAARAEPTFGDRPIYVFTHANRMNRATRREVDSLGIKLFDKTSVTREDLVQIFATTFLPQESPSEQPPATVPAVPPASPINEMVLSGALNELIAGVREQSELLASESGARLASGAELLSRVSSLASCAKAAELPKLARHAKALEKFLGQLCSGGRGYPDAALSTVTRSVEVMSQISFQANGNDQNSPALGAVFIDEAPYSNRAMEEALLDAGFQPVCFEDPARAREHLGANGTELIVANVVLPEAHGLALADLRSLPLHAQTPVLFGPDSALEAVRGELPTSAPRLDRAPLLLSELILKCLNAAQSTDTLAPAPSAPERRAPVATPRPFTGSNSAPGAAAEDGFELFARIPQRPEAFQASAQSECAPTEPLVAPVPFDQLFASEGTPNEPILRAEPGASGVDHEAELLAALPVTPVDGSLVDERPIEALAPGSQVEAPLPTQPEPVVEDQAAAAAWLAAAAGETGHPVSSEHNSSEFEQEHAAAVQESAESAPNNGQLMNTRLQASPADFTQGEAPQTGEAPDGHRNSQQDLIARVCAAEMALYTAQKGIEQRDEALAGLEKQLAEAKGGPAQPDQAGGTMAEQKALARCAELEEEIAALRQVFEGFNGTFGEQQQASAQASEQVQELEGRLRQTVADLEKQKEEQQRAEIELRRQLDSANAATQQSEAARKQAEEKCAQLEQKVAAPRPVDASQEKSPSAAVDAEQKQPGATANAGGAAAIQPASDLEQQLRAEVAALARATAELAKERGERQRSQQRAAELNGRLQTLHQDLSHTLQAQREDMARISALEEQQHQTSQALERSTADLEQHKAEHRLAEEQLQKAKEANTQLRRDLAFFEEANKKADSARQELQTRLEATLGAARDNDGRVQQDHAERQRLTDDLEATRRELQNQSRRCETLEKELQGTREALQEREAKLRDEAVERQRLNQTQDSFQRNLRDGSERDLEFSKLQSAFQLEQIERKRQETQLARTRQSALDAAHAARALRTSLRRQVREPVENLIGSARSLLELEMGEEQKKLAESVLENVLLVHTRLREPGLAKTDSPEPTAPPAAGTAT